MATQAYSDIASALNKKFESQITRHIQRASVLFAVLPPVRSNSQVIQWTNTFGTAAPTTAAIADGADVSTYNSDSKVPALLDFTTYHDAFGVSGRALAGALAAGNPEQIADLFAEEIRESTQRLAMSLSVDMYSGDGTSNKLLGLVATAGGLRATGTYATVNRGTFAQFAGNELLNGGVNRDLSLALMRLVRKTIYDKCGEKPDVILCSTALHEKYAELLGQNRRYIEDVAIRGRKVFLDGGYNALEFDGIPVLQDVSAPANRMLFLNTNYVAIKYLPHALAATMGLVGEKTLAGTPEEQFGQTGGMPGHIVSLARAGDMHKFAIFCYPQIVVRKPNAHAILGDLNE